MSNSEIVFSGDLKLLNLADIMQILGTNGSSGVLRIISRYISKPGLIYFKNGDSVNAKNETLTGLDAVFSFFGWTEGHFEFSTEKFDAPNVVNQSRMEIILNGIKMLDDGVIEKVGAVSFDDKTSDKTEKTSIPVIKGPLVDYMYVVDEEEFFDGESIIEKGKHGGWIWVILEGVVNIVKDTPQGQITVLRIGDGSFVGNMSSFVVRESVRGFTAVSSGNVQLGVLDSQTLSNEFSCLSEDFRIFLQAIDSRLNLVVNEAGNQLIKNISSDELSKNKKLVIKQGKASDKLYTITQGEAVIASKTPNGYIPLISIGKGDFFGNISFLQTGMEPEKASVFGSDDLKVKNFDVDKLQEEFNTVSPTLKKIIENTATSILGIIMAINKPAIIDG